MGVSDAEKIVKGLERCLVCNTSVIAPKEGLQAYLECEYTTGLYCRKDRLLQDAIDLLKGQPQIVRCKDCKWRGHEDDSPKWIPCLAIRTNNDWFCADGERKVKE